MANSKKPEEKRFSAKKFKEFLKNGLWVYKTMYSLSPRDSIIVVVSSLITSVIPTLTSFFNAKFIDELIKVSQGKYANITEIGLSSKLIIFLSLGVLFQIVKTISSRINRFMYDKFNRIHFRKYEFEIQKKISELDISQQEDPDISNSIKKAQENFFKIQEFARASLVFIEDLISTTISAVISFTISPWLGITIIILSLPNNYFFSKFIIEIWNYFNSTIEESRRYYWLRGDMQSEPRMPEHKIVNSNQTLYQMAKEIAEKLWAKEISIFAKRLKSTIFSSIINIINTILISIVLINRLIKGEITVGTFSFYEGTLYDFSGRFDYVVGQFLELFDFSIYITYVKDIIDLKPAIKSGDKIIDIENAPTIEFKNVSFKYPKSKNFALRNISLKINPKEEIAIVGENGAGKTTLIKLLLRFYDVTSGDILINNVPIKKLDIEHYRKLISALFQEYNTYGELDVKTNINIGKYEQKMDIQKVKAAAEKADAHTFIEELDNKYDQILSKRFTGGTNLSTGQWQKIALARMFYRDTPLLILDEPTASIDAEAEFKIFKRIYNFMKDKTVIIISHRFSTVRNAKKIYVLEKGQIKESGTHEELMKLKGNYAKAFEKQAVGYQKD
ncbi:ABC transporter ATP-binding protein [Candidatus Dojkabacteria bacterium]|nr:ABC transporter ATP-binding protein [Candidatus Dojkabacteria bacterium]